MKNLNEVFGEYDETPQRRRGGYILSMETQAEARSRRRPAVRATPRLDRARNLSRIHAHMLEKEARE